MYTVDDISNELAKKSRHYAAAVNSLTCAIDSSKVSGVHVCSGGKAISIRMEINGKKRSRKIPMNLATSCFSPRVSSGLLFSFYDTYGIARYVKNKLGFDSISTARHIESMLIEDVMSLSGQKHRDLSGRISDALVKAIGKCVQSDEVSEARRKLAMEKAKTHVKRIMRLGLSKDDMLTLWDMMSVDLIVKP